MENKNTENKKEMTNDKGYIKVPIFLTNGYKKQKEKEAKLRRENLEFKRKQERKRIIFRFWKRTGITALAILSITSMAVSLSYKNENAELRNEIDNYEVRSNQYQSDMNYMHDYLLTRGLIDEDGTVLSADEEVYVEDAMYDMPYEMIMNEYSKEEIELLAATVFAEAGNQDFKGKQLVVDVVLNRMDNENFPDTIEEVIKQDGQFETWSNGMIERATPSCLDYLAVFSELIAKTDYRIDNKVLYFTAGKYNSTGTPAYVYGDHYFNYE